MPTHAVPLTDARVRTAKAPGKPVRLADAGGLYLWVTPAGGKFWRLRYRLAGREQTYSIGQYPAMSLAAARLERDRVKIDISAGRAPTAPRPEVVAETFEDVARAWHAVERGRWKPHHAADVLASLVEEVFPALGALPLAKIDAPAVLAALRPMQDRGAVDTAHRVRQRIASVFAFAIASGRATTNPAAGVTKAMAPMPKGGHRPAVLDLEEAREVLRRADAVPAFPATKLALRLLAMTAVRPGELRAARWAEFEDLAGDAPLWRVPGERMKMGVEHVVPLPRQAVAALRALHSQTGRMAYAFPSSWSGTRPMSENAMGYLLNRAGFYGRQVPHGWRATFSSIMNERFRADRAVIDLMLAHAPKDPVEAAYNRATHAQRRRELAQAWADMLMDGLDPPEALLAGRRR